MHGILCVYPPMKVWFNELCYKNLLLNVETWQWLLNLSSSTIFLVKLPPQVCLFLHFRKTMGLFTVRKQRLLPIAIFEGCFL